MPKAKSVVTAERAPAGDDSDPSALLTPSDLAEDDRRKIADKINGLVADAYVLYVKTKNFHWHMAGPNFRDYHLMLDEQSDQIFATIDPLAERVRKLGQKTIHSLAQTLELTSLQENNKLFVSPAEMLNELCKDNVAMAKAMRAAHKVCDDANDVATASLLEIYIDETEKRTWFLFETSASRRRGRPLSSTAIPFSIETLMAGCSTDLTPTQNASWRWAPASAISPPHSWSRIRASATQRWSSWSSLSQLPA